MRRLKGVWQPVRGDGRRRLESKRKAPQKLPFPDAGSGSINTEAANWGGLAVFNRYGLGVLAGVTDICAPVSARAIRHDEIDAHWHAALRADKVYRSCAEDRFYFGHTLN